MIFAAEFCGGPDRPVLVQDDQDDNERDKVWSAASDGSTMAPTPRLPDPSNLKSGDPLHFDLDAVKNLDPNPPTNKYDQGPFRLAVPDLREKTSKLPQERGGGQFRGTLFPRPRSKYREPASKVTTSDPRNPPASRQIDIHAAWAELPTPGRGDRAFRRPDEPAPGETAPRARAPQASASGPRRSSTRPCADASVPGARAGLSRRAPRRSPRRRSTGRSRPTRTPGTSKATRSEFGPHVVVGRRRHARPALQQAELSRA